MINWFYHILILKILNISNDSVFTDTTIISFGNALSGQTILFEEATDVTAASTMTMKAVGMVPNKTRLLK